MSKKKQQFKTRKFYYRRAEWDDKGNATFESIMRSAHSTLDTVGKRTFAVSSGAEIRGAHFDDNSGIYLQIASYVPNESTSIIDKKSNVKNSTVSAQSAPSGSDYLDGDVFVFIKDDHVILCPSGVREKVADAYFEQILRATNCWEMLKTFELDKIAKASKVEMIRDEGVKEIELNTSLYQASMMQIDKDDPEVSGFFKSISNQFLAIFSEDPDLNSIKANENLNVKLIVKFDGMEARRHLKDDKFGVAGRKRLSGTANNILNELTDLDEVDDTGFVIVTGANNRITPQEVRVSDSYKVATLGKSLSRTSAFRKLKEYYDKLNKDGVLNQ
jgi:hypothetical protein